MANYICQHFSSYIAFIKFKLTQMASICFLKDYFYKAKLFTNIFLNVHSDSLNAESHNFLDPV